MLIAVVLCSTLLAGPAYFGNGNVTIELQPGMNLISIPISLLEVAPEAVLGSLGNRLRGCYAYECDEFEGWWLSYCPRCPPFLNTLEGIRPGQAIVVIVDGPETLKVRGEPIDSIQIQISPGWNFVGYNGLAPHPPELVFEEVTGDIQIVWTYDLGEWLSYIPGVPPFPGSIELMEPGRGYWILALNAAEWFFDGVKYHGLRSRADLLVQDIWTSPAQPLEDESVRVYARIRNDGYQPAFNVAVNFYERHPGSGFNSIGQSSVVMINGGQQATVSVNVPDGFLYQTIVKAVVDEGFPMGSIPELHEKNNRRTEKVHIRMPDPSLAAGELPIEPYFPFTDSNVSIQPEITNLGDADASNFAVRFMLKGEDQNDVWYEDVYFGPGGQGSLGPGSTVTVTCDVNLVQIGLSPGFYRFEVQIDPNGSLREINEDNNQQNRLINIKDPPELTLEEPSYYWTSPNGPKAGDSVRVGVSIRNVGASAANDVKVTFEDMDQVGGGQWSPDDVDLRSNETIIPTIDACDIGHTFNWLQNVSQGTHRIKVVVDYTEEGRTVEFTSPNDLPNLEVRPLLPDLWFGTGPYKASLRSTINTGIDLEVLCSNKGELDTPSDVQVSFYWLHVYPYDPCDLHLIGTATVGAIKVRDVVAARVWWSDPPASGDYHIVCIIDPNNTIQEVWETDNLARGGVTVKDAGPDLVTNDSWLWAVPRNPVTGQQTELHVRLWNYGDASATFATTFYQVDGSSRTEIATDPSTTAEPGQTFDDYEDVTVDWIPDREGSYEIAAVLDPNNDVNESVETNNEASAVINVSPRPYSIRIIYEDNYVDRLDPDYAGTLDGNQGKAWCNAASQDGCSWKTYQPWWSPVPIPYYDCDFEDRSSIRLAVYKTFRVEGPANDSTLADVTLDLKYIGVVDDLEGNAYVIPTGSTYWKVMVVAGITKGNMNMAPSAKLAYPMDADTLVEEDTGTLWEKILGTGNYEGCVGVCDILESRYADGEGVGAVAWAAFIFNLIQIFEDFLTVDAIFLGDGFLAFRDQSLEVGEEYTVFIYVDLVTAAVGLTSYSYADFYYHQPHTDPAVKDAIPERGIWLNDVKVKFK